ncbi:MAG: urease accessory protein UreF [Pseudanabaena sp. CAN_BIN31]|nr:urease accessory protein UreF [Pseudanabaena sp. CAN_BIN31]
MIINPDSLPLLRLLQITSPALPVGAYSYSEGIEYLCNVGIIQTDHDLYDWLKREMNFGFIVNEAAIALRAHQAVMSDDMSALSYWNNWLSATRETEEVRLASWQMGQSLMKLWDQLPDDQDDRLSISKLLPTAKDNSQGKGCNYAIAFGIVSANLGIDASNMVSGYIYGWLANLVSAAVRAVPFGQTTGQQILFRLSDDVLDSSQLALERSDDELEWCGWGSSLASTNHETQYSRLFRS